MQIYCLCVYFFRIFSELHTYNSYTHKSLTQWHKGLWITYRFCISVEKTDECFIDEIVVRIALSLCTRIHLFLSSGPYKMHTSIHITYMCIFLILSSIILISSEFSRRVMNTREFSKKSFELKIRTDWCYWKCSTCIIEIYEILKIDILVGWCCPKWSRFIFLLMKLFELQITNCG